MSLYVRVLNNFYTHRKTLRLRAIIGDAAFWVPPRLWAYAAANQPDGCFSDYTANELAMLIGYLGDNQALLQALLQVGFMDADPLRIHDWKEHNGYHTVFAERATKAANAKWEKHRLSEGKEKTRQEKTVQDKTRQEASIASSIKRNALSTKDSASPPTSEHVAFIDGWVQNFKAQFGFEYSFDGGRDGKAVRDLLRMSILRIDLLEIAKKAWLRGSQPPKSFNCEQASTIHGFRNYFNQIQVELKNGNTTHQRVNQRLIGVSQNNAVNNYAEAAKRKLERQMAQAENQQPPQASGNGA